MKRLWAFLVTCGVLMLPLAWGPLGTGLAEAQSLSVKLSLTSPAGGPSAKITHGLLTKDGVTIVGEFGGTLVVFGATASISVPVTDIPNGLDLQFAVPYNGTLTTYLVDPAKFAFDTRYFLPNPSLGGTVPPDLVGDPSTDAFFVLTLVEVEVSDDTTPPTCQVVTSEPAPGQIELTFTVQDVGSGLDKITVFRARNANVEIPPFTSGTTAPVEVTATIIDPNRTISVLLKVSDVAGNSVFCGRTVLRRTTTTTRERH